MADPSHTTHDTLFPRVVWFLVLVLAVDLWLNRHVGIRFLNPGALAGIVALITGCISFLAKVLPKNQRETAESTLKRWGAGLLTIRVLALLTLLVIGVGMVYSSVMVIVPDSVQSTQKVTVVQVGRARRSREVIEHRDAAGAKEAPQVERPARTREGRAGDILRFGVLTTPFGTPCRVEAQGYVASTFQVFPLTGLTIQPARDLSRSPSVLLRPNPDVLSFLEDGGSIGIFLLEGRTEERLIASYNASDDAKEHRRSSFLIGHDQPIPSDLMHWWELELIGIGLPEDVRARTLVEWSHVVFLDSAEELAPGMNLRAKVFSRAHTSSAPKVVAETTIRLDERPLIDIVIKRSNT